MVAEIVPDRWARDAYQLVVDGTPQSQVHLTDPTELSFEYIARMGHLIDVVRPSGAPITALHLGAGALTLPRYVDATRPGSRQQVLELHRELVDFVRDELPWDRRASIRFRYGDARASLARLPDGLLGQVDVAIVDVFSGATTPAHVSSAEFYRELARFIAPDGVVLVNVADGPPLPYARAQAATVREAIGPTIAAGEYSIFRGKRFGNVVLAASPRGIPVEWPHVLRSLGPYPVIVVEGDEFEDFVRRAPITTDATATGSPAPKRGVFDL